MNHLTVKGGEALDGNFDEGAPLYEQIAHKISDDVLKNVLEEEEQAPSSNELARLYSINPATAARGLNLLVEQGVLYKRRGLGMFVAQGARAQLCAQRRESFYSQYVQRLAQEAARLGIPRDELLHMIDRALGAQSQNYGG